MEYDDNDFQSQNLHLTGEGSSEFSPALHPYALPRFDFDESLQGHLRFESLVENEVFLGIPSQDDSRWIDDFARGRSGIEFSSSAVESCSISRQNNVWSEATSSESVEMLLKSVGQEDMVQGETIIEESDAGNELGTLTVQTEPNPRQHDIMENIKDSHSTQPLDNFPGSFSELNGIAGGEYPHLEHTLQVQDAELHASTGSNEHGQNVVREMDQNVVSEKCDLLAKENLGNEQRCDDVNQGDVDNSLKQSLNFRTQEDCSVCGTSIDNVESSSQDFINRLGSIPQNVIAGLEELNDPEMQQQESGSCLENASGIPKEICKGVDEHVIQTLEVNEGDQMLSKNAVETCTSNLGGPICAAFEVKTLEDHANETCITKFETPSILPHEGDGNLQNEGCNEVVHFTNPAQTVEVNKDQMLSENTAETCTSNLALTFHAGFEVKTGDDQENETSITKFEKPSILPDEGDGNLQNEGCNEDAHFRNLAQTVAMNNDDHMPNEKAAETCMFKLGGPFCAALEVKISEDHANETSIAKFEKPCTLPHEGGGNLQNEGCNEDVHLTNPAQDRVYKVGVSPKGTKMKQQPKCDLLHEGPAAATQWNTSFEEGTTAVSEEQICASVQPKLDDTEEKEKIFNDIQIEFKGSFGSFESSFVCTENNKPSAPDDKRNINNVDNFVNLTGASSSGGSCREHQAIGNSNCGDDTPCVPPALPVGSIQIYKDNLASGQDDIHDLDQDRSSPNSSNPHLLADPVPMEVEIVESLDSDRRIESLSLSEVIEEDAEIAHAESGTSFGNVLVFAVSDLESHATLIDASVPSGTGVNNNKSAINNGDENSPLLTKEFSHVDRKEDREIKKKEGIDKESSHADKKEEIEIKNKEGMHEESLPMPIESAPISEVEKGTTSDCSEILCETADRSIMDTGDTIAEGKHLAVNEAGSSDNLEALPIHCDLAIKQGDCAEEITEKDESATTKQNLEAASFKVVSRIDHRVSCDMRHSSDNDCLIEHGDVLTESAKIHCDSAGVISCTQLSPSDDKHGGGNVGVSENALLTKVVNGVDGRIQSDSTENDASKEEKSFTFDVSPLVAHSGESGKSWQSVPVIQDYKMSAVVKESPLKSSSCNIDSKMVQEISSGTPQALGGLATDIGTQITPARKTSRASAKLAKESAKKANHAKDTTPVKLTETGSKAFMSTKNSVFEVLKPCGNVENNGTKPGVISVPMLNLPDLNTLASSSALYQQPFTDLQQVQLRAQIFVYGSFIQGGVPDEACMISAFGPSDYGRFVWEPAWRACVERLCGHRSVANTNETPVQSHSVMRNVGSKVSDQAVKQVSVQSKGPPKIVGRANRKGASSQVVNPMIPLSSPLWNMSTPDNLQSSGLPKAPLVDYNQALSSLHPYQSPTVRNFLGHTTSGLSQAPLPGPWYTSLQTSPFNSGVHYSPSPTIETVKLIPLKEVSVPVTTSAKNVTPVPGAQTGGSSVFKGTASLVDANKVTVTLGHHSSDSKARKKKKVTIPEDLGQISLPVQAHTMHVSRPVISSFLPKLVTTSEGIGQISLLASSQSGLISVPVVTSHFSTSVAVTTTITSPICAPKGTSGNFLTAVSFTPIGLANKDQISDKKTLVSEDSLSKVEEAKLQAEVAAANASSAVVHCQDVWAELDKQKDSGLISDFEAKLALAAVGIAAAASVAKAAAAAANVASNVAVQARLMADEALASHGTETSGPSNPVSVDDVNYLGTANPASILNGEERRGNYSSSIIIAAREAARRRIEAASTAAKHAENLDAIIKAAELAAEAVSQTGKIMAMGDPLCVSELVHSAPDGYWKDPQVQYDTVVRSDNLNGDQSNVKSLGEIPRVSGISNERLSDKTTQTTDCVISPYLGDASRAMLQDHARMVDDFSNSVAHTKNYSRSVNSRGASDLTKVIGSNSVASQDGHEHVVETSKENSIKEGCLVEVFKDNGDCKGSWFSANILSLKDGKAFLTYTDLKSDEGQLKEWVPLEDEGSKAPKIRLTHPMTSTLFEGTRKRRRVAMRDYAWSVGDRVDAWIKNCWREGVVTEKRDETTLSISFPEAQGESSVVKVWHLRPTLVWKDGEWIEWSSSKEKCPSKGDTPREKRLKSGSTVISHKGKDKITKNVDLVKAGDHEESRLLPVSKNEGVFNVGRSVRDENKPESLRTMRTGLWKEGSRVVFGIPKPGKKRKFMEVSKHYVYEGTSVNNDGKDSIKFNKKLIPQGPGSHGWKTNPKFDSKEKQDAGPKSKVSRTRKVQGSSGRTSTRKDYILSSEVSAPNTATTDNAMSTVNKDGNESGQQNLIGSKTFSKTGAAEGQVLSSSLALPSNVHKKTSTSNAKSVRQNKGKFVCDGGKVSKGEAKDKTIPDVVEPRKSNRRIQPTSRLLEGLQSSLIISKIPSASHDKSNKSQNRVSSKRNNNSLG